MRYWMAVALAVFVLAGSPALAAPAREGIAGAALFAPRAAPADLPVNDRAQALIDAEPRVAQARHALEAAQQRARMLAAGSHEWIARASAQRRRYRAGAADANEWSVGLERAVRIGGKAALDRQLGEAQLQLAEARLGEARHEAGRELLELWLNWRAAEATRRLWEEQFGFAQASVDAAGIRRRAGDASLLEQNSASADLADVRRQLSGASNEEAKARIKLRSRYGELPMQPIPLADPAPLSGDDALWRERILAESDELRIAEHELRRAELAAARAGADRQGDPTVGVHAGSEAGGSERIVGLTLSIPLGGAYRNAQEREAVAQVEVARSALERVRRELESEVDESLAEAGGSLERWKFATQARSAAGENARLMQRAYTLGEAELQALLLARRQLVEASLGANQARLDALRANYRLLVDAHLIWGLKDD